MTNNDATIAYKRLSENRLGTIKHGAYHKALEQFDETDLLETAHNSPDSTFNWENIDVQIEHNYDLDADELTPVVGGFGDEEPEIWSVAREFTWSFIGHVYDGIKSMQEETIFSPREFVALILDAEMSEQRAAHIMDISVGNYRGKKGKVSEKLEKAESTTSLASAIRGE